MNSSYTAGINPEGLNEEGLQRVIRRMIEDSLHKTLGETLALATRVCLDTNMALRNPFAYYSALGTILGTRRKLVVREIMAKLRTIPALRSDNGTDFCRSIVRLRSLYSEETIAQWR